MCFHTIFCVDCFIWLFSAKCNEYLSKRGQAVAQLVDALRYMHEGRGFDSRLEFETFHWHNPSYRTIALGCTQPLREMSTNIISLGGKGDRYVGMTTLPPSCADCLEIWEPETPATLRACPDLYHDCFYLYKRVELAVSSRDKIYALPKHINTSVTHIFLFRWFSSSSFSPFWELIISFALSSCTRQRVCLFFFAGSPTRLAFHLFY